MKITLYSTQKCSRHIIINLFWPVVVDEHKKPFSLPVLQVHFALRRALHQPLKPQLPKPAQETRSAQLRYIYKSTLYSTTLWIVTKQRLTSSRAEDCLDTVKLIFSKVDRDFSSSALARLCKSLMPELYVVFNFSSLSFSPSVTCGRQYVIKWHCKWRLPN